MRSVVLAWLLKIVLSITLCINSVQACDNATTILTISGKITLKNDPTGKYCFSFNEFFALPRKTITTATIWTNRSDFEGPSILDVLKKVGAYGSTVEVIAENDYNHTILINDFKQYQPVLAYLQNGQRLAISDFGPLFLMYPRDTFPEKLSLPTARAKFVWNVYRLHVR